VASGEGEEKGDRWSACLLEPHEGRSKEDSMLRRRTGTDSKSCCYAPNACISRLSYSDCCLRAGNEMQGDIATAQFNDQPTLCPGLILSEAGTSTLGMKSKYRPGHVSSQYVSVLGGAHIREPDRPS
jgi:hypothetical protein